MLATKKNRDEISISEAINIGILLVIFAIMDKRHRQAHNTSDSINPVRQKYYKSFQEA